MAEAFFEQLWSAIDRLTERQRAALGRELARTPEERLVLAALNGPAFRPQRCPHCDGPRLQRWGMAGGVQRYRCSACLRTCNPLTGTPLARLRRRDLWLEHAGALSDGLSLRNAACRLGVHHHTTFRWRHRWLVEPAILQARALGGLVAIDAVPFHDTGEGWATGRRVAIAADARSSAAGVVRPLRPRPPPVHALLLRDHAGRWADVLLPRLDAASVATALAPLVGAEPAVLCSSGGPVFAVAARAVGVTHRVFGDTADRAAARDPSDVRGHIDRLAAWMARFRGVSTRYLAHYLGWRRTLERQPLVPEALAWLCLAHGRRPTTNVGDAELATARCRAGPRAVVSSARRPVCDRAAAACHGR